MNVAADLAVAGPAAAAELAASAAVVTALQRGLDQTEQAVPESQLAGAVQHALVQRHDDCADAPHLSHGFDTVSVEAAGELTTPAAL